MDYTQNPFLRGDDYSLEVADLRDDINELATEISQININLTDDIRNVDERLNVYQNSIKNNVYTNQLDANVANINNANIDYVYANNIKTNVLSANILNISSIDNTILKNPHIENMDAVNGQILNAEIKDSVIVNSNGSFNSINTNTVNIESGSIKRANISDSTLTNVVINGFDLNNPVHLNVNYADFNVANFNNIYGINANFGYIERVNTDNVRTTNIVVNGDARFHIINADSANIKNIDNTSISNVLLSNVKIKDDLVLTSNIKVNGVDANFIDVEDLRAKAISVQELTDVNLIHANNVSSDWGYIQNFAAHNLTLDVSAQPKETPYVLGYDNNGKVFPAIAQGGGGGGSVVLPENADYIYTDAQGLPVKGVAATDFNDSNALVKAGLVATLADQLNEITDALSVLNELKPNQTVDYFNSVSPLDYRNITSFKTNKVTIKDKNNYTIVADGVIGFTGLKVDNNILHLDSTLNNFKYNADLSYMFNGCSNFDGTGFDAIPEGTTNTAFMFADTKIKKPYVLPASVTNSDNMYKNVLFEATPGENIDGYSNLTYSINGSSVLDLNIINSENISFNVHRNDYNINNAKLNIVNSSVSFKTGDDSGAPRVVFNGGNIYFDNATFRPLGSISGANVTLKGNIEGISSSPVAIFNGCEVNATEIYSWERFTENIYNGNVYIGENTPVKSMFSGQSTNFPNIVYPLGRTSWAGLYYGANGYNQDLLNEILPTATNVDEMFYGFRNKDAINISNMLGLLNKDITSLYRFQNGNTIYNSLSEIKVVFPNVKNIGYSNLVKDGTVTEEEIAGFTDISGINAKIPTDVTTFNVPTLTTLENTFWDGTNNVNIVISNNCTFAPNVYGRVYDRILTGDLSGIKNGYWLYNRASQWFGYPENLETAQYMYNGALFTEIGEPIPGRLTNTSYMFNSCWNLTSIPEGFLDLSNCVNASSMFRYCKNIVSVDFNFLKTLKPGADISYIFNGCNNLVITDFNVFSWIPEGVKSNGWFSGKLACDVNTNNESIISLLNGQSIDGNVDILIATNSFNIDVVNNKSLNIDINTTTLEQGMYSHLNLGSNKYSLSSTSLPTQDVRIRLNGMNVNNSYFEVNGGKEIIFDGGQYTYLNNSQFVLTDVNNIGFNGTSYYGGPFMLLTDTTINLNNVAYLWFNVGSCQNVHINQMSTNGANLKSGIQVDGPASIDVLDMYSTLYNVTFVDNRLNINVLNNTLNLYSMPDATNIYLNSIGESGSFTGHFNNVIIHIPTNTVLATGLNNGTYGSFPSENIIQY